MADRMRGGGLLAAGDRIDLRVPATHPVALGALPIVLTSAAAGAARAAIRRRYLVKLGLLALCGAMALAIGALGVALQGRRQRILEIKAQFVAGVSHELRTPLASMRVLAETLLRRTQNLEQVRGVCDEAAERAGRSLRLQLDLDEQDPTVHADTELLRLLAPASPSGPSAAWVTGWTCRLVRAPDPASARAAAWARRRRVGEASG
jgi:signal transduction histidine kinase